MDFPRKIWLSVLQWEVMDIENPTPTAAVLLWNLYLNGWEPGKRKKICLWVPLMCIPASTCAVQLPSLACILLPVTLKELLRMGSVLLPRNPVCMNWFLLPLLEISVAGFFSSKRLTVGLGFFPFCRVIRTEQKFHGNESVLKEVGMVSINIQL